MGKKIDSLQEKNNFFFFLPFGFQALCCLFSCILTSVMATLV